MRKRKWMNLITSLKNTNVCSNKTADWKIMRLITNFFLKLISWLNFQTMKGLKTAEKICFCSNDLKQERVKFRENNRDWCLEIDDSIVHFTKLYFDFRKSDIHSLKMTRDGLFILFITLPNVEIYIYLPATDNSKSALS